MEKKLSIVICITCSMMFTLSSPGQGDNKLTKQEKDAGWILLFDGKSMEGWRIYRYADADNWAVSGGELFCKLDGVKSRADLMTTGQYENYELTLDWKIAPEKNSGIIYMVNEGNWASYESGPEYQLIDDHGYPEKLKNTQLSGADYDMYPPVADVVKPAGEYNHAKIIVNKGHVEHWLNGTRVVEYDLWSPEWKRLKEKSKWKNVPTYCKSPRGNIALQDHGGGTWFKNIKLKPL